MPVEGANLHLLQHCQEFVLKEKTHDLFQCLNFKTLFDVDQIHQLFRVWYKMYMEN